jgi:hypothetical protein
VDDPHYAKHVGACARQEIARTLDPERIGQLIFSRLMAITANPFRHTNREAAVFTESRMDSAHFTVGHPHSWQSRCTSGLESAGR